MKTLRQLLQDQWGETSNMVDYCEKSSIYIQSGETFINVGSAKPSIDKTLWFDDETDTPEVTFDYFRNYNRHHFPRRLKDEQQFVTANYRGDKTGGRLACFTINDGRTDCRPATADEVNKANAAIEKARDDYEKRLQRYWKRYGDKVHAAGYWVNR